MSLVHGTLYVAGIRGFHPSNSTLVPLGNNGDSLPRIRQAYQNMADLVRLAGGDVRTSCLRLVVYVSDMYRWRPVVNRVTEEVWGAGGGKVEYCPRSIVEVQRLNDDDIVEVEGTFWVGE